MICTFRIATSKQAANAAKSLRHNVTCPATPFAKAPRNVVEVAHSDSIGTAALIKVETQFQNRIAKLGYMHPYDISKTRRTD